MMMTAIIILKLLLSKTTHAGLLGWQSLHTDIGAGHPDPAQDAVQWPPGLPHCSDPSRTRSP